MQQMSTNYTRLALNCNAEHNVSCTAPYILSHAEDDWTWLLHALQLSLATLGVFCNTFIFIGLRDKNRRITEPDILLLNLTIWDTVFLSSRACQHIVRILIIHCKDESMCKRLYFAYLMFNYVARTSFITSILSTIPIAVERCMFSFVPFKVATYNSKKRTVLIIFAVSGVSLIISVPEMMTVACANYVYAENNVTASNSEDRSLCFVTSFDSVVASGVFLRLIIKTLAWIALLVLDLVLICRLCSWARMARKLYDVNSGQLKLHRSYNERSLTVAVMALVLVALVAHPVTGLVWVLACKSSSWIRLLDPRTSPEMQEVGRIIQLIYASSNLFFLLIFGTRFRRNLTNKLNLIRLRRQERQNK